MKATLQRTLTALLFLLALAVGMVYLALGYRGEVKAALRSIWSVETTSQQTGLFAWSERMQQRAGKVETSLTDTLDRDHLFIQSYGLAQRLLGRRVVEDTESQYTVAKLSNGALTFVDPAAAYDDYPDPARYADAVADLKDRLDRKLGIPLLYIQAPQKASSYANAALPAGLNDFGDQRADALLTALVEAKVDTLDLREVFAESGRYDALFFRTDHHWTPEGAFLAWQKVAEVLERDYGLAVDSRSTDPNAWEVETLENTFLGSQGKRVGTLYSGLDDFTIWNLKGENSFQYLVPIQGYDRTGSFGTSLCFPERLEESDPFQANPYTYYSGGDYSFARMKNLQNPDGPTVVLIRDSFACTLAPFMAAGVGEVVTIDLRYFQDDLMEYISWVGADLVAFLYTPGSLKTETMFRFVPEN